MDLLMGQDAPLLAFLFAISFWQLSSDRDTGAGFTLGLALFKFQLVIPFVVALLIGGRKRVLPGFATSAFAVLAISAVIVGWKGFLKYPGYLLALNGATGVGIAPESQLNLSGLITLLVGRLASAGRIYWALAPVALGAIWCIPVSFGERRGIADWRRVLGWRPLSPSSPVITPMIMICFG